jgi:hypothetical protein
VLEDPDPAGVPDQRVGLDVPLEDMRLDLEVTVVAPQPCGDRGCVLLAVVDGRLLEGEQVETREFLRLPDRVENLV